MQITFLGTAAATSYPLAFCRCAFCSEARQLGGKDHRKRSSVIINDDLLVDMGPDVVAASLLYNKSLCNVRLCLQTHPHSDHFDPSHLTTRAPEYLGVDLPMLEIYGSKAALEIMSAMLEAEGYVAGFLDRADQQRLNLRVFPVEALQTFAAGRYSITAFPSNHDRSAGSLLYSITEGGVSVFYATDTDSLAEETWMGLHEKKLRFDAVILDHTYGPGADSGGHLNADRFIEHFKRMKLEGLLSENARILATHISHEGNPPHARLSEFAAGYGYEIAFDGMTVDLQPAPG